MIESLIGIIENMTTADRFSLAIALRKEEILDELSRKTLLKYYHGAASQRDDVMSEYPKDTRVGGWDKKKARRKFRNRGIGMSRAAKRIGGSYAKLDSLRRR